MAFPHEDPLPVSRLKAWFSVGILCHEYSVRRRSTAQPPWRITAPARTAMQLLRNGVDRTVIALWLGYESVDSTRMYVYTDIQLKEKAMAKTQPVAVSPGRYRPNDQLLAFLETL